jgi:multidrug efflux pump subunit AcrB
MPAGKPVERTMAVVSHLEQDARDVMDEVDKTRPEGSPSVYQYTSSLIGAHAMTGGPMGGSMTVGGHLAQIMIQLLPSEERPDVSAAELNRLWREKAGTVADAESVTFSSEMHGMGYAVQVNLSIDDHLQLVSAAEDLKRELEKYPGVFDIRDSYLAGKMEMQLKLKPAARSLGLTLSNLASQVRHAFYGAEALRFQRDEDEVKVLVRYPDSERRSLGDVESMRIRTPFGDEVPFNTVAAVKMERGYATIQRDQRQRVITVYADVDETVTNANEVRMILARQYLPQLKNRYPGLRYSMEGEAKEQMESLRDVFQGFLVALFCIYALLAIPFKSFTQPFVVMSAIPFGLIGAIIGHLLMGFDLSMMSLMGLLGLAGVVVNDSLVLVFTANGMREDGYSAQDAITQSGVLRFRAVILTSLTTFVGLAPMLMERSMQAKFMVPMAVSLGFGVLFATGITLLLIPALYVILDDGLTLIKKMRGKAVTETVG